MAQLSCLVFNPFYENTYVVSDETGECVIIDPGCFNDEERSALKAHIEENGWRPVALLNTHCHIDHVAGNNFVTDTWGLPLHMHKEDLPVLHSAKQVGERYGFPIDRPYEPKFWLEPGTDFSFGSTAFKILFTPGHSPGSVSLYCEQDGFVLGGDVLFRNGIGRTDLPGGDMDTLLKSIETELMVLPEETKVFSGHGPVTSVGYERASNPFLI